MKIITLALATVSAAALAAPGLAQEHRELGAHEHGVGQLDIAIEGDGIAMALHAPGADIVGFEHAAESDEDKAMVTAALAVLDNPLALFELPGTTGCTVADAHAALDLEGHDGHDGHEDHAEDHGEDHENHDDHADHDDHDEDHAEAHDDHDDHDHDADDHDDHAEDHDDHDEAHDDHDDHDHDAGDHSEFHAEYLLTCTEIAAADSIGFTYFSVFPNARQLDIQLVTESGATTASVGRDDPRMQLAGRK